MLAHYGLASNHRTLPDVSSMEEVELVLHETHGRTELLVVLIMRLYRPASVGVCVVHDMINGW